MHTYSGMAPVLYSAFRVRSFLHFLANFSSYVCIVFSFCCLLPMPLSAVLIFLRWSRLPHVPLAFCGFSLRHQCYFLPYFVRIPLSFACLSARVYLLLIALRLPRSSRVEECEHIL